MKGSRIILSDNPRGYFRDCYVSGTPKPGTVMQIKAATEPVGGLYTYEVYNRAADGDRPQGPIAVLLEDTKQGKIYSDAYATGDIGRVYFPVPGDELHMLFADVAGTGDTWAIGDICIVDDGTGKLIATTGSPETECFVCIETSTALAADTHLATMFTGF